MIEKIEAHSYQSVPAMNETNYDGWLIRTSPGPAKRANSVNFPKMRPSSLPLEKKIAHCEAIYAELSKPTIFRINPLASPDWLEKFLLSQHYQIADPTDVVTRHLNNSDKQDTGDDIYLTETLDENEFESVCRLTELSAAKKSSFKDTLDRISIHKQFAFAQKDGKLVSCGLATYANGLMGLFEFSTDKNYRRQGLAQQVVAKLINHGIDLEIETAYLQVEQENPGGIQFWKSQGFNTKAYSYRYLIKSL